MRTLGWTLTAALSVIALGACERAPDEILGPNPGRPVAPSASNGADVDRFEAVAFTLIFDAERQLLAAHMPSDVRVCTGGSEPLNVVQVQRVITPSEIGQRAVQQTADERVAIYHATSPTDAGLAAPINFFGFSDIVDGTTFCEFIQGPNRIAEGTVQRTSTFSLASFHGHWVGIIQGVDGGDYHLAETYQLTADIHDPNNPDTFTEPVVEILLRPIP